MDITVLLTFFDKHTWLPAVITIPITIAIAIWQINRQLQNTLKSQKANKLDELHTAIYKEIAEKIEACETALSKADSMVRVIPSKFEVMVFESRNTPGQLPDSHYIITERIPELNAEHSKAVKRIAEVISVMDKYEIAFTNFTSMKEHICNTNRKLMQAMSDFMPVAMKFLPMDVNKEDQERLGTKVIYQSLPDPDALMRLRALSEAVVEKSMDICAYLHDLRIEAQNVLLSPIFGGKKAPARVPGDPRYPVLSLDKPKKG